MRLIDADALKKAMDGYWGRCQRIRKPRNGETAVFLDVMATVEKQPTINTVPVPVRHGKWIRTGRTNIYGGHQLVCSVCGDSLMVQNIECELYCRNCGARMDEEE